MRIWNEDRSRGKLITMTRTMMMMMMMMMMTMMVIMTMTVMIMITVAALLGDGVDAGNEHELGSPLPKTETLTFLPAASDDMLEDRRRHL